MCYMNYNILYVIYIYIYNYFFFFCNAANHVFINLAISRILVQVVWIRSPKVSINQIQTFWPEKLRNCQDINGGKTENLFQCGLT